MLNHQRWGIYDHVREIVMYFRCQLSSTFFVPGLADLCQSLYTSQALLLALHIDFFDNCLVKVNWTQLEIYRICVCGAFICLGILAGYRLKEL